MNDLLLRIADHSIQTALVRGDGNGTITALDSTGRVQAVIAPGSMSWSVEPIRTSDDHRETHRQIVILILGIISPELKATEKWSDARLIREGNRVVRRLRRERAKVHASA